MARLRSARSVSRKNSPISPPRPSSSSALHAQPTSAQQPLRARSHDITGAHQQWQHVVQGLGTVGEEPDLQQDTPHDSASIQFGSDTSRNTEDDLEDLDRDAIIDVLADLYDDSNNVFALFDNLNDNSLHSYCDALWKQHSSPRLRFRRREAQFLGGLETYGTSDFILPELIVLKIAGKVNIRDVAVGPALQTLPIIYIANLSSAILHVFSLLPEHQATFTQHIYNDMCHEDDDLDERVPSAFAGPKHYPLSPKLTDDLIDLSVDVVTQVFIQEAQEKLASEIYFDPDKLAKKVFWDEHDHYQGYSSTKTRPKAIQRLSSVRKHFRTDSQKPLDLDGLRQEFPWPDFALKVLKWSLARKAELDNLVRGLGGIDTIIDAIKSIDIADLEDAKKLADMAATTSADYVAAATEQISPVVTTERQRPATDAGRLRELRERLSARISEASIEQPNSSPRGITSGFQAVNQREIPQSPSVAEDSGEDDVEGIVQEAVEVVEEAVQSGDVDDNASYLLHEDEEPAGPDWLCKDPTQEIESTQQTRMVLSVLQGQQEPNGPENRRQGEDGTSQPHKRSFLDRQPNAHKVNFTEASDDEDAANPPKPTKRPRPIERESESEEEEFQLDTRPPPKKVRSDGPQGRQLPWDRSSRRAPSSNVSVVVPSKPTGGRATSTQPRSTRASAQPSGQRISVEIEKGAPAASHGAPPSSAPPPRHAQSSSRSRRDTSPPFPDVRTVNAEAKRNTQLSRALRGGAAVQVRRGWTEAETHRLIELVELVNGPLWVRIREEDFAHADGPELRNRDQVALKDKARNVKMDFLKARRRLPAGFEKVSIGNRMVGKLRELGIDYVEGRFEGTYDDDDEVD
ncbi:hypothetical protein H2204_007904 [Knufia peltigerae]|uniref:Myb-like domain-containing protein n=1 Tax=Knufia peltigerae TaxID=1002370 RepID=A0AA38Y1D7_9EURO|nr:hypothetical protein H2204_007904 [Knufia peltigerae]